MKVTEGSEDLLYSGLLVFVDDESRGAFPLLAFDVSLFVTVNVICSLKFSFSQSPGNAAHALFLWWFSVTGATDVPVYSMILIKFPFSD